MNDAGISTRLKALRESSEPHLSLRKVADFLGMPASTYQHYETGYKKDYIPPDMAHTLAELFAQHGIDPDDVLALGKIDRNAVEKFGLRESDVSEYRLDGAPVNGALAEAARAEAMLAALAPGRDHASLWRVHGDALKLAGYQPGDMLVADLEAEPEAGDVVVAQLYDWHNVTARTVLRIYQPPYLVAASADPTKHKPELVDNDRAVIKAVVVGMFRAT